MKIPLESLPAFSLTYVKASEVRKGDLAFMPDELTERISNEWVEVTRAIVRDYGETEVRVVLRVVAPGETELFTERFDPDQLLPVVRLAPYCAL